MADVKWIKLATNIFDNRKIKQIETLPDSDAIIVMWIKLLCLAGSINDNGCIYFTKEIPYTEQMLSTQFNMPITTVQLALQTFEQFGMVEVIDNIMMISNWEKYQNIDGLEKIREQNRLRNIEYRKRQKEKLLTHDVTVTSHDGTDIEEDKKEDIKNKKKEINKSKRFIKPTLDEIKSYINENNLNVNAQYWYDYYESNGWKVGKNSMKDWKACVRRWNKTEMSDLKGRRQSNETINITKFDV